MTTLGLAGKPVMMRCGHAPNGVRSSDKAPVCVICVPKPEAYEVDEGFVERMLEGRTARCGCGEERPSSLGLAFFEYCGPGSSEAMHRCVHCSYYDVAHDPEHMEGLVHGRDGKRRPTVVERGRCPGFESDPDGREHDGFYCGHAGWD